MITVSKFLELTILFCIKFQKKSLDCYSRKLIRRRKSKQWLQYTTSWLKYLKIACFSYFYFNFGLKQRYFLQIKNLKFLLPINTEKASLFKTDCLPDYKLEYSFAEQNSFTFLYLAPINKLKSLKYLCNNKIYETYLRRRRNNKFQENQFFFEYHFKFSYTT